MHIHVLMLCINFELIPIKFGFFMNFQSCFKTGPTTKGYSLSLFFGRFLHEYYAKILRESLLMPLQNVCPSITYITSFFTSFMNSGTISIHFFTLLFPSSGKKFAFNSQGLSNSVRSFSLLGAENEEKILNILTIIMNESILHACAKELY